MGSSAEVAGILVETVLEQLSVVSFQVKKNGKRRENGCLILRTED
jgi:hypothetical protein